MIDIIAAVIIAAGHGHGHGGHHGGHGHRAHHAKAADYQVIEGCHWNGTTDWIYSDGTLCRGTGEDPTVDSKGLSACADHRLAVPQANGRVTCVGDDDYDDPDNGDNTDGD